MRIARERSLRAMIRSCAVIGALLATSPVTAQEGAPKAEVSCDRNCLEGFVDRYLKAMAGHKVDPALFAPQIRFSENGVELPFGTEGLWATSSGLGAYRFYVPDVETQQIGFFGTVLERQASSSNPDQKPDLVAIALRLRIAGGRITEVEQIAARPDRPVGPGASVPASPFPPAGEAIDAMGEPHPIFLTTIPRDQRQARARLIETANYYFDAVERNTGNDYYPFTTDCLRRENGNITAGPPGSRPDNAMGPVHGCAEQLRHAMIGDVTSIRDRRIVAVDRERGIVFSFAFFDHRMIDWTWEIGEIFRIEGEKIRRVEAVLLRAPYGMCSGWSTQEQCRSEEPRDER